MSGMQPMRGLIKAWESSFTGSWSLFALAALPNSFLTGWALVRLSPGLSAIDYAEWAFLTLAITVFGSVSQLGIKPGYMQHVTDQGADARFPGLRAAIGLMTLTGAGAGLLLAFIFIVIAHFCEWKNVGVLPWLIPTLCVSNITMMLHTDLRILGRSSAIALLSLIKVPLFIGLLEGCLGVTDSPLTAFYASNAAVGLLFAVAIAIYGGVFRARTLDLKFLKWAVALGLPAMGALMFKYSADLALSACFRWLTPTYEAGLYGLALKLTEPLMGLYISSFLMAWGAFVYGWIKSDPGGRIVSVMAHRSWWYALGTLPVGLGVATLVWEQTTSNYQFSEVGLFLLMCLSRAAAFGVSSPMGFGQIMQRNYRKGLEIHLLELTLTLLTLPVGLYVLGVHWALFLGAMIPWITVFLLYRHSKITLENANQAKTETP